MTLTLPPELERALTEQARAQNTTPELLVLDSLQERFAPLALVTEAASDTPLSETMYDFLKDYIGVIDSSEFVPGGAQMSTDTGKKFAEGMVKKREQGKL